MQVCLFLTSSSLLGFLPGSTGYKFFQSVRHGSISHPISHDSSFLNGWLCVHRYPLMPMLFSDFLLFGFQLKFFITWSHLLLAQNLFGAVCDIPYISASVWNVFFSCRANELIYLLDIKPARPSRHPYASFPQPYLQPCNGNRCRHSLLSLRFLIHLGTPFDSS